MGYIKKGGGLLGERTNVRFSLMDAEKAKFPIVSLCKAMDVSQSGFYARKHRPESSRAAENRNLKAQVKAAFAESRETYGSPRIRARLKSSGIFICKLELPDS